MYNTIFSKTQFIYFPFSLTFTATNVLLAVSGLMILPLLFHSVFNYSFHRNWNKSPPSIAVVLYSNTFLMSFLFILSDEQKIYALSRVIYLEDWIFIFTVLKGNLCVKKQKKEHFIFFVLLQQIKVIAKTKTIP